MYYIAKYKAKWVDIYELEIKVKHMSATDKNRDEHKLN